MYLMHAIRAKHHHGGATETHALLISVTSNSPSSREHAPRAHSRVANPKLDTNTEGRTGWQVQNPAHDVRSAEAGIDPALLINERMNIIKPYSKTYPSQYGSKIRTKHHERSNITLMGPYSREDLPPTSYLTPSL
jgi:hypothetical protein